MKYEIIRLDGRFTYRDLFGYAIKFSNRMAVDHGPLQFNDALKWFMETYGWSAEIRDYSKMQKWTRQATTWMGGPDYNQHRVCWINCPITVTRIGPGPMDTMISGSTCAAKRN